MSNGEVAPNNTIYINNLNEKIKLDELKKTLKSIFQQFGNILEVLAFKTLKHKGQAWVVFEDVSSATNVLRQMQGFPLYDKPMKLQYAKTKSDVIAKADGTFVPREKRKKHDERADRKRREQHQDASQSMGLNAPYSGPYGAAVPLPYLGGVKPVPEAPAPPNKILFFENLPHETTPGQLQIVLSHYHGFKEVRMIDAKPGIAFVEFGDEMQSTVAMQALQGFKMTPQAQNQVLITYAKK
ncbi:hypothetical protein MKW98_023616 [Papaver atlanticum]|uniref:RRM domain-containing protein n=1 Tax=Papaver atlanticum TaxID=357466 RepID=A0AAD4SZ99_9MAGN|nr:hypothetical protein MKW98_023616 [Papaver atlanticum]